MLNKQPPQHSGATRIVPQDQSTLGSETDGGAVPLVDMATFKHLLSVVGAPDDTELLGRLRHDFQTQGAGLPTHPKSADFTAIQKRSHVLIALAGVIGAAGLETAATALNDAAHRHDIQATAALCQSVQRLTCDIIAFLDKQLWSRRGHE